MLCDSERLPKPGRGWGGGRSGGQAAPRAAELWLPGELGDEPIFCVLDVARVSGAPQDRPKVQERAGRRKAGSAASGQAEDGPAQAGAPRCRSRGSPPAPARNCQGLFPVTWCAKLRTRLGCPVLQTLTLRGAGGNLWRDEEETRLARRVWRRKDSSRSDKKKGARGAHFV